MEFKVEFAFDCINRKSLVMRKYGEFNLTSEKDIDIEALKWEDNAKIIKDMIYLDIKPKVKYKIFNIEILNINLCTPV